ncbi:MAG: extracellular solute-binding protein [Defluviitaleaceae bacterium]|nr:extracellular solute-binding protein [Defluviitaleaceae bacterium]
MKKHLVSLFLALSLLLLVCVGGCATALAAQGPEVTILVTGHPSIIDWNTNAMSAWMEEQTGLKVNYKTIPLEGRLDALSLELSSRDYPDAFMTVGMNQDLLNRYGVGEGRLLALNDLILAYAPNLQKIFESNPGYEGLLTMTDGNIYCMPNINQCYHCTMYTKMWINQAFLNNVGKAVPTTTDELLDALRAFRDMDANGNGDPNDELPFIAAALNGWGNYVEYFLMNSFTFYDAHLLGNSASRQIPGLYVAGGTVKTPWAEPGCIEGLKFMNLLFNEGLLYEGSFTAEDTTMVNLVESGDFPRVGMAPGGYGGIFCELGGERYQQFVPLLPLKGPDGRQELPRDIYDLNPNGFYISADSPYAAELVQWADKLYAFEATMNGYYGPKDTHWREAETGELGLDGKPALYAPLVPWQEVEPQNDHWVQMCISNRDAAFRAGEVYDQSTPLYSGEGLEKLLYDTTAAMEPYANSTSVMPPVILSEEQSTAISVPMTDVKNLLMQYVYGFMNGTYDIDAEYDGFLQQLAAAGLDDIVAVYQAAYDVQFK